MIRALELLGSMQMQTRAQSRLLKGAPSDPKADDLIAPSRPALLRRDRRPPSSDLEHLAKDQEDASSSPYFTPRRSTRVGAPPTPISPLPPFAPGTTSTPTIQKRKRAPLTSPATPLRTPRKRKSDDAVPLPQTPESLPRPKRRRRAVPIVEIPVVTPERRGEADKVIAPNEKGVVEQVDKILLLQERVRHDPWKLLIATSLLNKTSGRAVKPIYWELLRRYPTPQALAEDLTDLIYPLGLFNQRASSLIRMSQQYLSMSWPISHIADDLEQLAAIPWISPDTPPMPPDVPEEMDVHVFYGAGVYASDSFRIYSSWFPGRGGPEDETRWIEKRKRAIGRMRAAARAAGRSEGEGEVGGVEEVGEYLSDEEEEEGETEWRKVRPLDKELRRYLIWRWGLEGITYDIARGPLIKRARDRRRLAALLSPLSEDEPITNS